MKKKCLSIALLAACAVCSFNATAQYYELANQLPGLIQPALSGSLNYKGFLEASYTQGLGKSKANILGFSTSQGFRYSNWFFMGVGVGVDILFSNPDDGWGQGWDNGNFNTNHSYTTKAVMIPLFTDFRFNIGNNPVQTREGFYSTSASFFIDVKVGCSFLCSDDYIRINNGYLTNQQYFFLRPSMGVRIPVSSTNPKQAVNIGVTYQLLTSNYWSSWSRNVTLNSIGANLSFEW